MRANSSAGTPAGSGYLLKDRVADVDQFIDGLRRVAGGGAALDPEVISQLLVRSRRVDPLAILSPREQDVLRAMAEGKSNAGIAQALVVGEGAVEKHISNIFLKLRPGTDRRGAPARARRAEGPGVLMTTGAAEDADHRAGAVARAGRRWSSRHGVIDPRAALYDYSASFAPGSRACAW